MPPNMAKEASLRICNDEVELLTGRENLDMIEVAKRGEVCSVYEMRKFTANKKYLPDYDSSQPSTFGFCVDANNLYGGVMQNEKLPHSDFTLYSDITLAEILNCPDDNPVGYFLEVDCIILQVYTTTLSSSPSHHRKVLLRMTGSATT